MLKPDFTKYSLALIKDNKLIYSSTNPGLRPLVECINNYEYKLNSCTLHDKIIGLAAARLIVYSKMISSVFTKVCSKPAKELLGNNYIELTAEKIVNNILNKDKSSICPMELKAKDIKDNKLFFLELKDKYC